MKNCFYFTHRFRFLWSVVMVTAILSVSGMTPGRVSSAYSQTTKPTTTEQSLTQIKEDTDQATSLSRKLDKQIRRLRTVAVVSLAVTAVTLVVLIIVMIYLVVQKRFTEGTGARLSIFPWKIGTDDMARILHRQRKLARAVADLQDFADQSRESNSELSVLLDSVRKRLKELDAVGSSSSATIGGTVTPAAKS